MIEHLKWDSDFFNCRIGRYVHIGKSNRLPNSLNFDKFDCVYIFSNVSLEGNWLLVDIKLTFQKTTMASENQKTFPFDAEIHSYDQLLDLVYQSGHDSRFLKDPFFGKDGFKKLYKRWIDNSLINRNVKVLVAVNNNKLIGFVAVTKKGKASKIDLIAVDMSYRGMGIGAELVTAAEAEVGLNKELMVSTQETNLKACEFYEKLNFKLKTRQYIYHYGKHTFQ